MFYVSFAFKSFICFDFKNLSIYDLYVYYYWTIRQIRRLSDFIEVSEIIRNG
jgi:hypothetical protein